ncbi:MAG: hypothetical protein WCW52_07285 [Elusimicrobiales bacterium]|jgi:hypothetical protein
MNGRGLRAFGKYMGLGVVLALMPVNFSGRAFSEGGGFEVPPASVNTEELGVVRDRLSTSLFFRGELADSIIEAGLAARLVGLTGRETRSEVRLALIGWAKTDLIRAADMYFYLKNRQPGESAPPEVISYKVPSWVINPNFVELVEDVNKAARDASAGGEEMSVAAQRLFEGPQTLPEAYAPLVPGRAAQFFRTDQRAGQGGAGNIGYADYRLDRGRTERESRALGGWFESVKSAMKAESRGAGKEKGLTPQHRLFDETFSLYRDFVVALSGLKGRTKITGEEAARLEALRLSLRKNLGELETLSVMRRINDRAQLLPARSPGARILKADALRIEKALMSFLEDLGKDPESVKSAGSRLYALEKAFDFWELRFSAHERLAGLKDRISDRGFSCVLDKLIFEYLSRVRPGAAYVTLEAGLAARAKAIDISLEGVAAGDYETAAFFSGGKKKSLAGRIFEAEAEAARLESYSRFNRRLQFFFWDALVNPFGLVPGPKGISAENILQG